MDRTTSRLARTWHPDAVAVGIRDAILTGTTPGVSGPALVVFRGSGKQLRVIVDNGGNFLWGRTVASRKEGRRLVGDLTKRVLPLTFEVMKDLGFEYLK